MSSSHPDKVSSGADCQYDEEMIQKRAEFCEKTRHFLDNIPRLVRRWKDDAEAEFHKNLENSGNATLSFLTTEQLTKLREAQNEKRVFIISSLKSANDNAQRMIEELQEENPYGDMLDLRLERFKASIEIREKMIADLEKEKQLVETVNESRR
ncbi:hypothetical protein FPOAC2_03882 [Fusarium poae]